jgi:hypothetical protein
MNDDLKHRFARWYDEPLRSAMTRAPRPKTTDYPPGWQAADALAHAHRTGDFDCLCGQDPEALTELGPWLREFEARITAAHFIQRSKHA